tara:strand:+ start:960 stop:1166 length:207 start_codon:yes stop_codon:yes gene_type:complete
MIGRRDIALFDKSYTIQNVHKNTIWVRVRGALGHKNVVLASRDRAAKQNVRENVIVESDRPVHRAIIP